MVDRITYVGLDVHKEGIVIAVAAGSRRVAREAGSRIRRRRWTDCCARSGVTA